MLHDWIAYYPTAKGESVAALRNNVPSTLASLLINRPKLFQRLVAVEKCNTDAICELDKCFKIESSTRYIKDRRVEFTIEHISEFDYFFVGLSLLRYLDDVEYEVTRICENCPFGEQIGGILSSETGISTEFGLVERPHRMGVELVASKRIRCVIESEELVGLTDISISRSEHSLMKIAAEVWCEADAIVEGTLCKKHNVWFAPTIMFPRFLRSDFTTDFCLIRGVSVKGKRFLLSHPEWVVSRRALRVILREVHNLRSITMRLDEPFRPLLMS